VRTAAHHASVVTQLVVIDPMASDLVAMLVEVQVVTVRVEDPSADVERVRGVVLQRTMRRERQHVMVVRPLPASRNLLTVEPSRVNGAELFHVVLDGVMELQPNSSVRVHVGASTAR
jgi:hypothetical protein